MWFGLLTPSTDRLHFQHSNTLQGCTRYGVVPAPRRLLEQFFTASYRGSILVPF